ncbi:sigma 54-interacting transcriptional regulator [Anaerosalibacter massiliensis]|uniref:Sigma 54-interacting transcriptional regulator n=1 Tax=Anaerosalibacter massiliensis TaxID=1347392 RepID=A0A9X2MJG4_9FIRM|nr:sigma 54-interacting transcriptional regulator [Anaerosalibacter massiliensis]MCR2045140.1 sigma 54-interacting transcriptional regulator [Anaerosalibacter massiliensis]
MEKKVVSLINNEDEKNPLTDNQISKKLNVQREYVTMIRNKMGIPNSRDRMKEVLFPKIQEILNEDNDITESDLAKILKKEGYKISLNSVIKYKEELLRSKEVNYFDNNLKESPSNYVLEEEKNFSFKDIIGCEGSLKLCIQQAKAAILYPPNGLHTLILGPSGAGKSDLATAMFKYAKKSGTIEKKASFIVFNCADYAENPQLLMAQLFGYKKGAFTGANENKAGLVEKADGSILFLDEVHRLPPEGQEMLFYLLDKGRFRRLGDEQERKVQVTIISATTESPDSVLLTTFRRRIPMVIELPDLNSRPLEERFNLIKYFFSKESYRTKKVIKISSEAMKALLLYDCPGNVGQLRSDIQVSCARSFLNSLVKQDNKMEITLNELPVNVKTGSLKIQNNRKEIHNLVNSSGLIVFPNNRADKISLKEDLYVLSNEIYTDIEERYIHLQNKKVNQEAINYIIGNEMEQRLKNFMKKVNSSVRSIEKSGLTSIVGEEIVYITNKILNIAKLRLSIDVDNLYYVLAIHLNTTINRIKQGKLLKNPQLDNVKKEFEEEFEVAKEMVSIINDELNINLSEDEAGFITMYLRMSVEGQNQDIEGRVGVLVMTHGNVAKGMLDVANRLLGVNFGKSLEMSLDEKPQAMLDLAIDVVKKIDEGKGVLLLVDMGSLTSFGELISKKTGIEIRVLPRVDTVMVIEAVRRAILPSSNLDDIADTLLEENIKVLDNSSNNLIKNRKEPKTKAIITICITGQGSAKKIKDVLSEKIGAIENNIDIIPIGVVDYGFKELILNIKKNNNLVAIVGTINPNIYGIPYVSFQEVLDSDGISKIERLLRNHDYISSDNRDVQDFELIDIVRPSTTILDMNVENKEDAILKLGHLLYEKGFVEKEFIQSVLDREEMGPVFFTEGVVIPHGDVKYVKETSIAFGRIQEGIEWGVSRAMFVGVIAIKSSDVNIVQSLYDFLNRKDTLEKIMDAKSYNDFIRLF